MGKEKNEQEIQAIANEVYVYLYPLAAHGIVLRLGICHHSSRHETPNFREGL